MRAATASRVTSMEWHAVVVVMDFDPSDVGLRGQPEMMELQ